MPGPRGGDRGRVPGGCHQPGAVRPGGARPGGTCGPRALPAGCPWCQADGRLYRGERLRWVHGRVRGKAAARLGPFIDQVRELLRAAGVLYADESGPSKSSSAPPAAAGAPCRASPTLRSSTPTCLPPPNGASTPSTHSPSCSPPAPGYQRPSAPAEQLHEQARRTTIRFGPSVCDKQPSNSNLFDHDGVAAPLLASKNEPCTHFRISLESAPQHRSVHLRSSADAAYGHA